MANKQFSMDSQILEEVIRSGNIPCHGRTGMLCSGGGLLPPALLDESRVPKFYLDALVSCGATTPSSLPNTALVYNLMVTSGLPKDVLAHVFSAVNRSKPGQLTRPEFFSCLALIALAQKGESLAALCAMDSLPIPFLSPIQSVPSTSTATSGNSLSFVPFAKIKQTTSAFIPTSLLPRKSMRKKKEPADLIHDSPVNNSSSVEKSPAKGASNDLLGINFYPESQDDNDNSEESANVKCWRETVHAIFLVFQEANGVLGKASNEIMEEIASTEKGANYLRNLSKAHEILERVSRSAGVLLPTPSNIEAEACRKYWNRLSRFVVQDSKSEENDLLENDRNCAICCQRVTCPIEYGGQCYDVTCANLWVNNVSSLLPNQHLRQ